MSNWKNYKLAEITEIRGGKRLPKGHDYSCDVTEFPYLRVVDFSKKTINKNTIKYLSTDTAQKISRYIINKEDVYISIAGTIGLVGTIPDDLDGAYLTENAAKLVIRDNKLVHKDYLVEYLSSNEGRQQIKKQTISTSQPKLSLFRMGEIMIPIPCIEVQLKIVKILKCVQQLIDKRKEQIQALDELVKSQFIEMFGDPVSNPKGWKKAVCKEITSKIGSGATPSGGNSSYKEEGISLIRSMNVHNNKFVYKDLAFIDDEQAKKLKNVIIEENDILLNITGASVARSCIVPSSILPARVNQHVSIIRCKTEEILPIFLVYQFTSQSYQRKLWDIATSGGATREAITKQQLENLELIVPPIELQNQFADFVKQVDKLKVKMEKSLKELEDNFNSLMQRAFNGELFSE